MINQRSFAQFLGWGIFVLIVGVVLPLGVRQYQVALLTEIIIFALFAVSYNLLLGYAGLLSFGHAMFFGVGAYTVAIVLNHISGLSFFGAVMISVMVTTVAGFAVGSLLLRHKGVPFALLTLAFNALFYAIATKWHSITGGDDGLSIRLPDINLGFAHLKTGDITVFYYITLLIIGSVILFCWYFTRTAMGQTVLLVRENEERMKFVGYNTNVSRLILFVFTGFLAGLAGSFYTLHYQFTSISAISIDMSTIVVLMVIIGGTGSFIGPILGACVYIYLQDFLSDITDRWPFIMGLIFIFMILYVPRGLSGLIDSFGERLRGRWHLRSSVEMEE
ncbi:MAG: branched-chain amino acid ABC transporter permease [Deltaproteobacteria bacterium]|nr:MAG: branched-chain amino acid ABC transporter permease [Deltaproteobacteria bacterium]